MIRSRGEHPTSHSSGYHAGQQGSNSGFRCIKTLDGFYHQQRRRQRSSKSGRQARTSSGSQQLFPFPFQNMSPTRDKCSYIRPYLNRRPLASQRQPRTESQHPSAEFSYQFFKRMLITDTTVIGRTCLRNPTTGYQWHTFYQRSDKDQNPP